MGTDRLRSATALPESSQYAALVHEKTPKRIVDHQDSLRSLYESLYDDAAVAMLLPTDTLHLVVRK